jgi:DNA-binding winged helix-turn-helix (wHTH) protein
MENDLVNSSKNEVCYILNERVWFYPEIHKLIYDNNGEKQVLSLNIPASRCLMLLIDSRYNVVSRDEFIEQVWRSFGRFVALNTYYQNISILRKSLRSSGLDKDAILTVPRRGLALNKKISIEKSKSSDVNDLIRKYLCGDDSTELDNFPLTENQEVNDKINEGVKAETSQVSPKLSFSDRVVKKIRYYANRKVSLANIIFLFVIIVCVACITFFLR